MIRTDLGECGMHWEGEEYIFSPSFFAMSQIGDKKEIVDLIKNYGASNFVWNMTDAAIILIACCTSHDAEQVTDLIGRPDMSQKGHMIWRLGKLPQTEMVSLQIIAKNLLWSGVIGRPNERRIDEGGEPLTEFDATEYASSAMALLHIDSEAAWRLTMIEFQRAIDTLYPPKEDKPTKREAAELFKRTDDINEMLNRRRQEVQGNG